MRIGVLSAEELAKLLDVPLDAALSLQYGHKRLREGHGRSGTYFMKTDFDDRLAGISNEEVNGLMNLTVREVQALCASGEIQQRYTFLGKSVPETDAERLKVLRELLQGESEFRTRYPTAHEVLFGPSPRSSGLSLPSLDVTIPDLSWSLASASKLTSGAERFTDVGSVTKAGEQITEDSFDYGSILSLLDMDVLTSDSPFDRAFEPMSAGHIRGLLLTILGRDEYSERIDNELHSERLRMQAGSPSLSLIRLTDLRLASRLGTVEEYKSELEKDLQRLHLPLMYAEEVIEWKASSLVTSQRDQEENFDRDLEDLLKEHNRARRDLETELESRRDDEKKRSKCRQRLEAEHAAKRRELNEQYLKKMEDHATRFSFSSAALLLFYDLDLADELSDPILIARKISSLADIIRATEKKIEKSGDKLHTLLSSQRSSRPREPRSRHLKALIEYRLGRQPIDIARDWFDINVKRNADWQRLEGHLGEGAKYEKSRYPAMAKIMQLYNSNDAAAKFISVDAYDLFAQHSALGAPPDFTTLQLTRLLGFEEYGTDERILLAAHVQLGCCIRNGIVPYPPPGIFNDLHLTGLRSKSSKKGS